MRLVTLIAAAGLAYAAYSLLSESSESRRQAPRRLPSPVDEGAGDGNRIRDAGEPTSLGPLGQWDEVDEASDESFPASDPPARY